MAIPDAVKNITGGHWLFTCTMEPQQFSHWNKKYNKKWGRFSRKKREHLVYGNFETLNGSSHSLQHCGLKPVSERYAAFFIQNKLWQVYNSDAEAGTRWIDYENKIRKICTENGIDFEGL